MALDERCPRCGGSVTGDEEPGGRAWLFTSSACGASFQQRNYVPLTAVMNLDTARSQFPSRA